MIIKIHNFKKKTEMKKLYLFLILFFPLFIYGQTTDLIITKWGEGSSNNKFIEIYNGTGQDVDLSNYSIMF